MGIGDWRAVADDACRDYYYLDVGSYEVPECVSVYIVDGERPALLDTGLGTGVDRILGAIEEIELEPVDIETIALTHVHLDHAGGAGHLIEHCPNATVYVHQIGAPHLIDPTKLIEGTKRAVGEQWRFYRDPQPIPPERIVELSDGDVVDLGDRVLEVHHVPGHAPHQVVYHDPDARAIHTADAAGIWIPSIEKLHPTSPPPNFDLERCLEDVDLLRALEPRTLLFPHFGPGYRPEAILDEYRDVLTDWIDAVADRHKNGMTVEDIVDDLISVYDRAATVWGDRKARDETRVNVRGAVHYLDRKEST